MSDLEILEARRHINRAIQGIAVRDDADQAAILDLEAALHSLGEENKGIALTKEVRIRLARVVQASDETVVDAAIDFGLWAYALARDIENSVPPEVVDE